MPLPVRITATGAYLPGRRVTSAELDTTWGRPEGTTLARSGVRERHWIDDQDTSTSMGLAALRDALDVAGWTADSLDVIVGVCVTPEQPMPTNAIFLAQALGVAPSACFDVSASCLSALQALDLVAPHVAAGRWRRVAIVASEAASLGLDHDDIESSALFGDGAAAWLLEPAQEGAVAGAGDAGSALLSSHMETLPDAARLCEIRAGGTRWNGVRPAPTLQDHLFHMEGPVVFRHAMRVLPGAVRTALSDAGVRPDELCAAVPHQASGLGMRYVKERLGLDPARVVDILVDHGNQVSASLPTALHEAGRQGLLRRGEPVLLLGTGAGLLVGAAVLRW